MARLPKRIAGFRPTAETFKGVRWHRANRLAHEVYRPEPRFSIACKLDWSRALKRPDNRHMDGRQLALVARVTPLYRIVYYVAYVKRNHLLYVISVRYAQDAEIETFARYYP
jgi:uncharacterized DUF497 family protein